jgi:hypothetical protein
MPPQGLQHGYTYGNTAQRTSGDFAHHLLAYFPSFCKKTAAQALSGIAIYFLNKFCVKKVTKIPPDNCSTSAHTTFAAEKPYKSQKRMHD